MKDYFEILGVGRDATEEEIRKAYRRLAMRHHPDRNPDDPAAEERFREIAEAYGVLSDPLKRAEYLRCQAAGTAAKGPNRAAGFNYSQEEILRDLFNDPRFQQMLRGLLAEFGRSGFRMGPHFLRKIFLGQGRGVVMGGFFFFGSLAGPTLISAGRPVLKGLGRAVRSLLSSGTIPAREQIASADVTYHLRLSAEELRQGKDVRVLVPGSDGRETLRVRVPPHSRAGQRLRLRGKGAFTSRGRGDLYLCLEEEEKSGKTTA